MTPTNYRKYKNNMICNSCHDYEVKKAYNHDKYNAKSFEYDFYTEVSSLYRSERGDIYSKKNDGKKTTINPLTNEEVPVYGEEEQKLIERTYEINDDIEDLSSWLERNLGTAKDRGAVRRKISVLYSEKDKIEKEINEGRDGSWLKLKEKQEKLAKEKEKKREAENKKKKVAQTKADKKQAKLLKERQKAIDDMPDELKEVMDDLFS